MTESSAPMAPSRTRLTYAVRSPDESADYSGLTGEWVVGGWRVQLASLELNAESGTRYERVDDARATLEPLLESWEAHAEIALGQRLEFTFTGGSVLLPDGRERVTQVWPMRLFVEEAEKPVQIPERFPAPPEAFVQSDRVKLLRIWRREVRARPGRYLAEVYWFLTYLRSSFGGSDPNVAESMRISRKLLTKISKLQAVNDPVRGRKAQEVERELLPEEVDWLEQVLDRLVLRIGEIDSGEASLTTLDMGDFPQLPKA